MTAAAAADWAARYRAGAAIAERLGVSVRSVLRVVRSLGAKA